MQKCIVCNSTDIYGIYNDTLVKCNKCGMVSANMEIGEAELKAIYNSNYFKGEEYLDYVADKTVIQKNFSKRMKKITRVEDKKITALEIGCAYGFFGEIFTMRFKDGEYQGVDIVKEAIDYGKKNFDLDLILEDYLDHTFNKEFSHAFMWDVIEHLPDPDLFIQKISKEIMPLGELHITTGDMGGWLPRLQKNKWRMIHPPTHLHYFNKKSLSLLLEKNGFKVKKIYYQPVYRSVRQIYYSLFLLKQSEMGFRKKIFQYIPENWFIPINTYDIMHCVAVKK